MLEIEKSIEKHRKVINLINGNNSFIFWNCTTNCRRKSSTRSQATRSTVASALPLGWQGCWVGGGSEPDSCVRAVTGCVLTFEFSFPIIFRNRMHDIPYMIIMIQYGSIQRISIYYSRLSKELFLPIAKWSWRCLIFLDGERAETSSLPGTSREYCCDRSFERRWIWDWLGTSPPRAMAIVSNMFHRNKLRKIWPHYVSQPQTSLKHSGPSVSSSRWTSDWAYIFDQKSLGFSMSNLESQKKLQVHRVPTNSGGAKLSKQGIRAEMTRRQHETNMNCATLCKWAHVWKLLKFWWVLYHIWTIHRDSQNTFDSKGDCLSWPQRHSGCGAVQSCCVSVWKPWGERKTKTWSSWNM